MNTSDHSDLVKEHFESKYYDYDVLIRKLVPRYDEMHQLVVDAVSFPRDQKIEILDLGIGTGQTSQELLGIYPHAHIDGVDISPSMLTQARDRLGTDISRVTLIEKDIKSLVLGKRYDACVAVLSVHHLDEIQKPELFKKIFARLNDGGVFAIGDLITFNTKEETQQKEEEWRAFLYGNLGEQEGQYWFDNSKEEDLPSSVPNQLRWLKEAGFTVAESLYEHMNYAVLYGKK